MEDRITDVMFQCFATSPKDVIFHAQLHGTFHVNVSDLAHYLQEWANFDILHFPPPLVLESFCTLNSSMPVEQCPGPGVRSPSDSTTAGTAVGVVVAIIFIILVIIVIAILLLKYRRQEILKTLR